MELLYQFYKRCASVNAYLRRNLQSPAHADDFFPFVKKIRTPEGMRRLVDISKLGLNSKIKNFSYSFIGGKG